MSSKLLDAGSGRSIATPASRLPRRAAAPVHAYSRADSRTLWLSLVPAASAHLSLHQATALLAHLTEDLECAVAPEAVVLAGPAASGFGSGLDYAALAAAGECDALLRLGARCLELVETLALDLTQRAVTVALLRGPASGASLEVALAAQTIVAERGARLGFPETQHGWFPGFGGFSLLARKIGLRQAQRIVESGEWYDAEAMAELGVIDVLVEPGEGEGEVRRQIERKRRALPGLLGYQKAKAASYLGLTRAELRAGFDAWVAAVRAQLGSDATTDRLVA